MHRRATLLVLLAIGILAICHPAAAAPTALDGADVQVNTYTTANQAVPAVAADADGDFVVVWQSKGAVADTAGYSIQARRYRADGTPRDVSQFQVNTYTTSGQNFPAVAADGAGNFVVVWSSGGSAGGDTISTSIQARRFRADGTALDAADFQVNTYTTGTQTYPVVAVSAGGNFVVVWQGSLSAGGDSSNT